MTVLHRVAIDNSTGNAEPVLFLHGFGGAADQWRGLQTEISFQAPTLAFDLPGHGKSLSYPDAGPPKIAAKAVLAELKNLKTDTAHIVGHSMGGAIASLIALMAPERVLSLTLLAPGGFGTKLNYKLLRKWASAQSEAELKTIMPNFYGSAFEIPQEMIEFQKQLRQAPGARSKLMDIAEQMFEGGVQGVLPVEDIVTKGFPVCVIWGRKDQVLPVAQAEKLAGKVELHILDGVGHSPAVEAPERVRDIIQSRLAP